MSYCSAAGSWRPMRWRGLVVQEVIAHRAGDLADDVTVVCLDWRGPAS